MAATKERIVDTTAQLFRRNGYTGTGLKQIVAQAGAPFGSIYHFFPGGKEQLGQEVIRRGGDYYRELVEAVFEAAPDAVTGTGDVFAGAAETLRQTDYADACPIATVALEVAGTNEPLREATAEVFESWIAAAAERLVAGGVPQERARDAAIAMLALLEGAFVLSRAMRTTEAVEVAGAAATEIVTGAMGDGR